MKQEWVKIDRNIYVVKGVTSSVFFVAMVNGKRKVKRAPIQGSLAINNRGRATPDLKRECINWIAGLHNEAYLEAQAGLKDPTFGEIISCYEDAADKERLLCGRPLEVTSNLAVRQLRMVMAGCGLRECDSWRTVTEEMLEDFITTKKREGLTVDTAWSYVMSLRAVTARWTERYYTRAKLLKPPFKIPLRRERTIRRYKRPTEEELRKRMEWYASLEQLDDKRLWLAATMMAQFAVRDGDVKTLTMDNFIERNGRMYLKYTPHKTLASSGRVVMAEITTPLWARIKAAIESSRRPGVDEIVPGSVQVFDRLNSSLRIACKMEESAKAMYEFRKMCIDHIYQKFGAEAASAISGDRIDTICRYYADPSMAAPPAVDMADLVGKA